MEQIAQVDDDHIQDVVRTAIKRYAELFPDWEIGTFSLQKSEDKNEQIDRMIAMLNHLRPRQES